MQFVSQDIVGVRERGRLEDLRDMFQTNSAVSAVLCRKVKGRTSRELEIGNDCIGTDGVEDISEGLGGERGYGEVDGGCEEGEKEGRRGRVVGTRGI